MTILIRQY